MTFSYGTCDSVRFLKNIGKGLDLCEVIIEFDAIKIFYPISELEEFVGHRVQYITRQDVIDGVEERVICEIAKVSTIQVVSSVDNIKLIPEGNSRTVCNFAIKDVRFGEFYPGRIAYLSSYKLGASRKAKWIDCTLIDKESKEFDLRIFASHDNTDDSNERMMSACVGRYVEFDMESTKYGYQTKSIEPIIADVELSPEVTVAMTVLNSEIDKDPGLISYRNLTDVINKLKDVIDGEPGYALVRIASEIYLTNAIDSISSDLDIRAMKRAAICSRGYLLPHKVKWSKTMLNTNMAVRCPQLKTDMELMYILDTLCENPPSATKRMYIKIRGLVNDIIDIRRSFNDEKALESYSDLLHSFNGML